MVPPTASNTLSQFISREGNYRRFRHLRRQTLFGQITRRPPGQNKHDRGYINKYLDVT